MHAASITMLCWALIGAAWLVPGAAVLPVGGVLALLVAVVGLPHGAADHRFARPRLEPLLGRAWWAWFLAGYLAIAAAVVGGWFLAPAATIVLFFLASAWHFGQEEPAGLIRGSGAVGARQGRQPLEPRERFVRRITSLSRLARGGLVVWVSAAMQPDEVVRVLTVTAPRGFGPDIERAVGVVTVCAWVMLGIAVLAWIRQIVRGVGSGGRRRTVLLLDAAMIAALAVLFAGANPLVGFLVYFCGWHSVRGLRRLRRELGESWAELAASLAPLTALAIGLLGVVACLALRAPTWNDTLIRATFVGLSALAVPHLVLHGAGPFIERASRNRAVGSVELGGVA